MYRVGSPADASPATGIGPRPYPKPRGGCGHGAHAPREAGQPAEGGAWGASHSLANSAGRA